jgi:hypothetical protein
MPGPVPPLFRVLIATPLQMGQMWCETAHSLLSVALKDGEVPGLRFEWEQAGGQGVAGARNELTYLMYAKKCHAVLWWDSDIVATPTDILGLVRHGKHLVGGMYRHKTEDRRTWVANFIPGEVPDANGALKVEDCGAGFLFATKFLLDTIIAKGLATPYTRGFSSPKPPGTVMHDFFSMGVVNDPLHNNEPTYKTEDFMLAHKARLAGFDCFVDTQVRVDHMGVHKFRAKGNDAMPEPWKVAAPAKS